MTKQRQVDTFAIPANITPVSVEATTEGLLVEWPRLRSEMIVEDSSKDSSEEEQRGHSSLYPWSWLYSNSYAPSLSFTSLVDGMKEDVVLWGKGIAQQPPSVTWADIMSKEDERGVARWLNKLVRF